MTLHIKSEPNDAVIASQVNVMKTLPCLAEVSNRRLYIAGICIYNNWSFTLEVSIPHSICLCQWYVPYVRMVARLQTQNLASRYVAIAA